MKKIGLLALGLALALGVVAEAGSIPADRVPLQTYAVKKMNCYLQPNGVQKGWIDPGDYVVVTQIRSDGWAYGSYPVGNGRVSRWFRADDLVNNIGFANQERYSPKANTNTYTGSDHSRKFGSFNDNEPILVVSDSGQSRQFIYKVNGGGYKMAWAPYWDCWDARQAGKQQVNNNVINKNPIVKPVQREDKKQEQSSSYGVWKATARYTANTYDNESLSGARAGWVTAGSDLEVLGENAKSYFIRYWADNGAKRERYVERTAVKGLNEDKENINNNNNSSSFYQWSGKAKYRTNTYDNESLSGARAGWVTAGSDVVVLAENSKSFFIRYWTDNGDPRERYVMKSAIQKIADGAMYGVNKAVEAEKKENYIWPVDCYKISTLYYYLDRNKEHNYVHSSSWRTGEGSGEFDHHESIDIAVPTGYSVRATAAGVVVHAYNMFDQYGKVVIIRHANNVYSLYGHLSRINVAKGANVSQGDIIGQSGNTGNSTGAHLHFAISKFNDQNMNTWKYFRDKYKFSYPTNGITANKKHSDRDSYSKEAIQWLNSHPHETW